MGSLISRIVASSACLALAFASATASAQDIQARWELEADHAVVGQSLALTIEVRGIDSIDPPRFSVPGVRIEWNGGGPRNSTSIVSVNGKTTRTETKAFVGSWSLRADAPGAYHLDPLDWKLGGRSLRLDGLDWSVAPASTSADYLLSQDISPATSIPGVDVSYSLTWYLGDAARNPEFSIPLLDDPDVELVPGSVPKPTKDGYQLSYRGQELFGLRGTGTVKGRTYTTIVFKFKVRAKKSKRVDLSGTRVTFAGVVGKSRGSDFFGNEVEEPKYGILSAQADAKALVVRDLPEKGKPKPFSGLIGRLSLSWEGAPKDCQVGEPLHLRLVLGGVLNRPDLDLDHMVLTALSGGDFQISADPSLVDGKGDPNAAVSRSYVLRAARAGSLRLPALKLTYYDPETQRYGETRTQALSIEARGGMASSGAPASGRASPGIDAAPSPIGSAALPAGGDILAAGDISAGGDIPAAGDIPYNPPGIARRPAPRLPWWFLALPGAAAGAVLAGLGSWRHSRLRRLRLERKAWRARLSPLGAAAGRQALEEGRARLRALADSGGEWGKRLSETGKATLLTERADEWDRAFFSDGREGEPWSERWEEIAKEATEWK